MTDETPQAKVGSFAIVPVKQQLRRFSALIWGPAGCGKTTLASTAPGRKLWINFDPDGPSSIAYREDVDVLDLSNNLATIGSILKDSLVAGLRTHLAKYDTVVVDSLSSVQDAALTSGISQTKGATIERPSPGAYGVRTAYTKKLIQDMLMETGKLNKHIIFIAHEDKPERNEEGIVIQISMMLGGQLPVQGPVSISEVWAMYDNGRERRIAVRPCRSRSPMKTRMFNAATEPEFTWRYDALTNKGPGIKEWYESWQNAGFEKISLPK